MNSYRELKVYSVSMDFTVEIYRITASFPKEELYCLVSQMRRCAVSIPSNIAEGSGRRNTKEFIQFLYVANGSLSELETQIEISKRLNYIRDDTALIEQIKHIRSMLIALIHKLVERSSVK